MIIGRLNAFEAKESGDGAAAVEDVDVEFAPHSLQAKMVSRGEQRGADVNIEDADILVAGGRGLGKAEGFEALEDAGRRARRRRRGDARGGRRGLVLLLRPDRPDRQDGRRRSSTWRPASPARSSTRSGMQGSENIVAINKDANAPIFEFSDLGDRRRPQQDRAQAHRGREGPQGRLNVDGHRPRSSSRRRSTRRRSSSARRRTPRTSASRSASRSSAAARPGWRARSACCSCSRTTPR